MRRQFHKCGLLILICSLIMTGCWDRRELEDRDLVIALALDKIKEGLNIAVQVPIPANIVGSGGSGGGSGQQVQTIEAQGTTISDGLSQIAKKLDKSVFLGYLELLMFGEEQAKDGIHEPLDLMRRESEIQRNLYPVVVRGQGKELLENGTKMEQIQSVFINRMIDVGERTERMIDTKLNDLLVTLSNPYKQTPILNYVGLENGKYRWLGLAVFREDKMVGTLNEEETVPLLQIRNMKRGKRVMSSCPKGSGRLQFMPLKLRRNIDVTAQPAIKINLELEGNITEDTCTHVFNHEQKGKIFEKQIEKSYRQRAQQLVKRAQKDLNLDLFHLGNFVHSFHPDIYNRLDWKRDFAKIPIDVSYKVYIRRMGADLK